MSAVYSSLNLLTEDNRTKQYIDTFSQVRLRKYEWIYYTTKYVWKTTKLKNNLQKKKTAFSRFEKDFGLYRSKKRWPRCWPKSQATDRHYFRSLGLHRLATPGSGARSQPRVGWITSGLSSAALSSAASRSPFAYTSSGSWCVGLQSLPPQHRAKIS